MHKKFVPHYFNHVRLLRQKQNILKDLFINIAHIVGMSRRTSCTLAELEFEVIDIHSQ